MQKFLYILLHRGFIICMKDCMYSDITLKKIICKLFEICTKKCLIQKICFGITQIFILKVQQKI